MLLQASPASVAILQSDSLLPPFFVAAVCGIFGALIGSFLNVVIHRLPRGESIAFPNSRCPQCNTAIKFYDNIPVLSYLALGGKCRTCGVRISPRYPAVEALTATLFALTALAATRDGLALNGYFIPPHDGLMFALALTFDLTFVAAIIALIFIDAEHMILPNKITYPGFALALVARLLVPNLYGMSYLLAGAAHGTQPVQNAILPSFLNALGGAALGGGSLWLVGWLWKRLRGVDAMGLGDVKMMLMVGAYLGALLTPLTIFIGFLSGAIVGVAWMWKSGQRDLSAQIPFGIFLGIGSIISLLFGTEIIDWYFGQFRN